MKRIVIARKTVNDSLLITDFLREGGVGSGAFRDSLGGLDKLGDRLGILLASDLPTNVKSGRLYS